MKTCSNCKIQHTFEKFNNRSKAKDGKQGICRECSSLLSKERHQQNRPAINDRQKARQIASRNKIHMYKSMHPCVDCGEDDPIVLDFDHKVQSEKLGQVSAMVSWGWDKIQAEIDKCDIRCANCHRRRTAIQLGWYNYTALV